MAVESKHDESKHLAPAKNKEKQTTDTITALL